MKSRTSSSNVQRRVIFALLVSALLFRGSITMAADASRPNIVLILVDDMGWSDVGCYGSEIPTPHIDALAEQGLRFTQFYNTGRCCPTRAALLTGLYSHQTGVGHMTDDKGPEHPAYRGHLNDRCVTLGNVLGSAGYLTALTGKWHVGNKEQSMWPLQRGFDRFYGVPEGGGFYFKVKSGRSVAEGNEVVFSEDQQPPEGWYSTDEWVTSGLRFIDEAQAAEKPFFLHLCHNAPHFPLQAPQEDIDRFRGKYRNGWQPLREARYQRQLEMGLVKADWPLSELPDDLPEWSELTDEKRDRFDHLMAIYAAVMERMDRSIGTLVAGLKERGVLDNTLILFLSDNGGNAESGVDGRLDGDHPGDADSNVFCGKCWATLSNTPFRRYKHFNHEGGIASPLIVHWPAGIKVRGELRHQPCHLIDIMTTLADVSGAEYPETQGVHAIQPAEGVSLLSAFANASLPERPLFWEHEGNAAVRLGDWKLVRLGKKGKWELYDLAHDRTELQDLSEAHPERASELKQLWQEWARRCHVNE